MLYRMALFCIGRIHVSVRDHRMTCLIPRIASRWVVALFIQQLYIWPQCLTRSGSLLQFRKGRFKISIKYSSDVLQAEAFVLWLRRSLRLLGVRLVNHFLSEENTELQFWKRMKTWWHTWKLDIVLLCLQIKCGLDSLKEGILVVTTDLNCVKEIYLFPYIFYLEDDALD